jgi:hypothetical protein
LMGELFPGWQRVRRLTVAVMATAILAILVLMPQFGRAYSAGRLATSPVRPLARYLQALPDAQTVVMQQLTLGRRLRPFLGHPEQVQLIGGRPGRIDPLPRVAASGPFLYIRTGDDDPELMNQVEQGYGCTDSRPLADWELWFCNGSQPPTIARFAEGIELAAATLPSQASSPLQLTLFWQTEQPIPQDYTVFVHVVDANGSMVGQWDQTPGAGESPTSTWPPGRLVVDEYQVPLHLAGSTPPYRILVGLYDAPTGVRLDVVESNQPVSDARLELATLEGR